MNLATIKVQLVREPENLPPMILRKESLADILVRTQPDDGKEHMRCVLMGPQSQVIGIHETSMGNAISTSGNVGEIFSLALLARPLGCVGMVITHNHPSGDLTPSQNDIDVTRRFWDAGALLEIELLDHIITANGTDEWLSVRSHLEKKQAELSPLDFLNAIMPGIAKGRT
jgi:DNA repair protein RadC